MSKILLIDDEGVVRGALKAVLEQNGHEVHAAADGREGLALLKKGLPDLVVLDRDLPRMTGSAVLQEIRKISRDVRVMVLTGYPDAPGENKYRRLGITHFLSKGIGIETLLKVIERDLAKTKRADGTPADSALTVLVIDDDPNILSVLRRFLEGKGYRVAVARNGREGMEALQKSIPNLVLLDIDMPVMNGIETLKKIREIPSAPAVIMITGNEDMDTARKCMSLGACDYIVKPLNFEYLELSVWAKILTSTP